MEPIISPWIVYIIDILLSFYIISWLVALVGFLALIFFPIVADIEGTNKDTIIKYEKRIGAVFIISTLLWIFIPSQQTMLTMLVLQYTTPDNIELVQTNIVDFIQNIVQAVKAVK